MEYLKRGNEKVSAIQKKKEQANIDKKQESITSVENVNKKMKSKLLCFFFIRHS